MWAALAVMTPLAAERASTSYGEAEGLHVAPTTTITQDAAGFLWVGTQNGLARFDGERFQRIGAEHYDGYTWAVAPLPDGRVYVAGEGGPYLVQGNQLTPTASPGVERMRSVCLTRGGMLWGTDRADLWVGGPDAWKTVPLPSDAKPNQVRCEGETVFLLGATKTWERTDGGWDLLAETPYPPMDAAIDAEGHRWVLPWQGPAIELRDGERIEHPLIEQAHVDLQDREGRMWISSVRGLEVITEGLPKEVLTAKDGVGHGGGSMLDVEGGLWRTSPFGLELFHEPDVAHYQEHDGLSDNGVRRLTWDGQRVWAAAWGGLSSVGPEGIVARWPLVRDTMCTRDGVVWGLGQDYRADDLTYSNSLLLYAKNGEIEVLPGVEGAIGAACALDPGGTPWFAVNGQLYRVQDKALVHEGPAPGDVRGELHATRSALWWLTYDRGCRWDVPDWQCFAFPGAGHLTDAVEREDGVTWLASANRGVIEVVGDRSRSLGTPPEAQPPRAMRLTESPRGGVWLTSVAFTGRIDRVEGEWKVLEKLDFWQGFKRAMAAEVLEVDNGDLWVATYYSLAHVPERARRRLPTPPRLVVASSHPPVEGDEPVVLSWETAELNVQLAALTYRDRTDLEYRFRLKEDAAWLTQSSSTVQLVDLSPGTYRFEAQASLDGEAWSDPVAFSIEVPQAPWFRWWAILGYGVVGFTVLGGLHRLRLRQQLALDRERRRIALDLHDELGGTLGGLGLGADILGTEGLTAEQRKELAAQLADGAREAGGALSDIVWSLRRGALEPKNLLQLLEQRARMMVQDGSMQIVTDGPEIWPATQLTPAASHAALMVGLEAITNAVKHSRGTTVTLRLRPAGDSWRLEIDDDGVGMGVSPTRPGGGNGLDSMHRRAERLGATLTISDLDPGTRVSLLLG